MVAFYIYKKEETATHYFNAKSHWYTKEMPLIHHGKIPNVEEKKNGTCAIPAAEIRGRN
jgi:hypothetical protein